MKTQFDPLTGMVRKESPKPYGDVKYADPSEGKYPIDTEEHIRAAWNYVNKPKNATILGDKLSSTKSKIIAAWKKVIDPKGPPSVQKNAAHEQKELEEETQIEGLIHQMEADDKKEVQADTLLRKWFIHKLFDPLTGLVVKGGPGSGPKAGQGKFSIGDKVEVSNPQHPDYGKQGVVRSAGGEFPHVVGVVRGGLIHNGYDVSDLRHV